MRGQPGWFLSLIRKIASAICGVRLCYNVLQVRYAPMRLLVPHRLGLADAYFVANMLLTGKLSPLLLLPLSY